MNENGVLTRAMAFLLSDNRCYIVFNTLQEANIKRADALRYAQLFWNIFKDQPWYGSIDDNISKDTRDSSTNDDDDDDDDNGDNGSEDTGMKLHNQAVCDSKWYYLIDAFVDEGETVSKATALVDLIYEKLEEDFDNYHNNN